MAAPQYIDPLCVRLGNLRRGVTDEDVETWVYSAIGVHSVERAKDRSVNGVSQDSQCFLRFADEAQATWARQKLDGVYSSPLTTPGRFITATAAFVSKWSTNQQWRKRTWQEVSPSPAGEGQWPGYTRKRQWAAPGINPDVRFVPQLPLPPPPPPPTPPAPNVTPVDVARLPGVESKSQGTPAAPPPAIQPSPKPTDPRKRPVRREPLCEMPEPPPKTHYTGKRGHEGQRGSDG